MPIISPTSGDLDLNQYALPNAQEERKRTELGQEDFLALMISQLQNQDPFQPMENGEFLGQMAQFSTVSGIGEMSASLNQLAESLYANQALQASSMIGKSVLTEGGVANLAADGTVQGAVDVPYASGDVFVRITAANGQLVREIPLGARNAGLANFEWDGIAADGTRAPAGQYLISAGARESGNEAAMATLVTAKVASVSLSAGGANTRITTETGAELSLSEIRAVM